MLTIIYTTELEMSYYIIDLIILTLIFSTQTMNRKVFYNQSALYLGLISHLRHFFYNMSVSM